MCPCLCYRNIQPVWAEKFCLFLNAFVTCETLSLSIYMATDNIYFLFQTQEWWLDLVFIHRPSCVYIICMADYQKKWTFRLLHFLYRGLLKCGDSVKFRLSGVQRAIAHSLNSLCTLRNVPLYSAWEPISKSYIEPCLDLFHPHIEAL